MKMKHMIGFCVLQHALIEGAGSDALGGFNGSANDNKTDQEPPKVVMYGVLDTLAPTGGHREHVIITKTFPEEDGREPETKKYFLGSNPDAPTPMPIDHALKFLVDKSFIVLNPDGQRIQPPARNEGGTGGLQLKKDQTIAHFNELSKPSLFKRCKMLPGGERITGADEPSTMIEFIMAWEEKQRRPNGVDADIDAKLNQGDLAGAVDKGQLEKMFGGDSKLVSH